MKKEKRELRLYGLVPYQLSGIQKGIQYGHANDVFKVKYPKDVIHNEWIKKWKTYIVLNGGTTNENPKCLGTMQKHLATLRANKIKVATFYEPDLNDTLTAIVFVVDERVFNKEKYPDFDMPLVRQFSPTKPQWETPSLNEWAKKKFGNQNAFLREFLKNFRLA